MAATIQLLDLLGKEVEPKARSGEKYTQAEISPSPAKDRDLLGSTHCSTLAFTAPSFLLV